MNSSAFMYAKWLSGQAFGFIGVYWPITLTLLAIVLVSIRFSFGGQPRYTAMRTVRISRLLTPLVFTLMLLIWGVAMRAKSATVAIPQWHSAAIFVILGGQAILSIIIVKISAGERVFASAAVALQFWISLVFAATAGMSVTANWI